MTATALQAWIGAVAALLAGALGIVKYFSERYSKPHMIEKKKSPRAASNASR
jgi:hypothetical protein